MSSDPFAAVPHEIIGDLKYRQLWEAATVKGSMLASRKKWLEAHHRPRIAKIERELSFDAKRYLAGDFVPAGRYPYGPMVELDLAIIEHCMGGDIAPMEEFGSEIAQGALGTGAFAGLIRLAGGRLSLRAYRAAYSLYWQPGKTELVREGDKETVELHGMIWPRYMCRHGVTGYVKRLLEIAGDHRSVTHVCAHDDEERTFCAWHVG